MKKTIMLSLLIIPAFLLAACSASEQASSGSNSTPPTQPAQEAQVNPSITAAAQQSVAASEDQTRSDSQGMVEIAVKPQNLSNPGDRLVFDVSMNTHSVDLSMDLAKLSSLTTDTGLTVPGRTWEAQPGGHHVSGKLIFPAVVDGKPVLQGAKELTLTITNVAAPQRVFTWQLP